MNKLLLAIAGAAVLAGATPVVSQAAPAPVAQAAKISFATTKINDLIKDAKAKAILEKTLPEIKDYYDQIGDMTLTDVIPMSQGAIDEGKIKDMQAEYDKG